MRNIIVIAHNLRSAHNIGSLLRTAEGMGVARVYLTGYTPHPTTDDDIRLPHESAKVTRTIRKTALGAESSQAWEFNPDIAQVIQQLKAEDYEICAVEQSNSSTPLQDYKPQQNVALLLGREVEGVEPEVLALCDQTLEIPMLGEKESFNVVQAGAIALYHCRYMTE